MSLSVNKPLPRTAPEPVCEALEIASGNSANQIKLALFGGSGH